MTAFGSLIGNPAFKPTTNRPLTVLPSPFFRLGWRGSDNPSLSRTFHSIRRSGGVLVTFFLKKKD